MFYGITTLTNTENAVKIPYFESTDVLRLFDNAILDLEGRVKELNILKEACENISVLEDICARIYPIKATLEVLKTMKTDIQNKNIEVCNCFKYFDMTCGNYLFTSKNEQLTVLFSYLGLASKF